MHYILLIAMKTMHRAVQKEWRKEKEKSERKGEKGQPSSGGERTMVS